MKSGIAKLSGLTVFGVASCVVYIVSSFESVPDLLAPVEWTYLVDGKSVSVELPLTWAVVVIGHTVFALRLYAQAWGIDQSPVLEELAISADKRRDHFMLYAEWLLRSLWVGLVSYLPSVFGKAVSGVSMKFGVTLGGYYVLMVGAVVVWDIIMFSKIIKAESPLAFINRGGDNRRYLIKALFWRWVVIDFVLLLIAVFMFFLEFRWGGNFENARPLIGFFLIGVSVPLCIIQLVLWGAEVVKAKNGVAEAS